MLNLQDRAFLHGTLSPLMRINRDFFKFYERELRDYSQPYFEQTADTYSDEGEEEDIIEEEEVITEKIDNKIEEKLMENTKQKEFKLTSDISNDLNKINEQNNENNNKFSVFKNSLYQQSDEAALSPVMANSGVVHNLHYFKAFFVFTFYTIYWF